VESGEGIESFLLNTSFTAFCINFKRTVESGEGIESLLPTVLSMKRKGHCGIR